MRFQTRLVLTLTAVVSVVTIALISVIGAKIRQTYLNRIAVEFEERVSGLERAREAQTEESLELSGKLASHPFVIASLKEGPSAAQTKDFWLSYALELRALEPSKQRVQNQPTNGPGKSRIGLSPDILSRIGVNALMTLDGEIKTLKNEALDDSKRWRYRNINASKSVTQATVKQVLEKEGQQTLFLPFEFPGRAPIVHEMVSTPVVDPESGETKGLFLRASAAETEAERSLVKYQEDFAVSDPTKSGIFLDNEVFSRNLGDALSVPMARAITAELEEFATSPSSFSFQTTIGEEDYHLHLAALTPPDFVRPAYQLAAFPITALKAELLTIRTTGAAIGAVILILAIFAAYFLARGLTVPVRELVAGTQAIRGGNLDHQVKVHSRDELGQLAESFNDMAEELKQKALYRELLGKVSDETVAQALVSGSLDLELGGEMKEVSVLFCDIRGFTRQTEEMHPTEVIAMLNEHMTAMTELVRIHGGVVDKFVGDEIMAVFGALKSYGNDAANAASCALEMIEKRRLLNDSQSLNVEIGIGVATGEVVAGCMGSVDRLNYTVLGSRVNLAARLCSAAAPMEVVTDDETISRIHPSPDTELISELELKGFSKPVEAFRLRSLKSREEEREPASQT